jgi:hypothetical protein
MEIKGKIFKIGETKEFGSKGFKKREMVVETNEQYPQRLLIDFIQDNCVTLDHYKVKDEVEVEIEIRGREWQSPDGVTKYFSSFLGAQIKKDSADKPEAVNVTDKDLPF